LGDHIKKIKWAGHVARMGEEMREVHTAFWWGNLRKGDHLIDPEVDGRIVLNWTLQTWIGSIWLRIGTGGGLL
jgi:hypothetical protein